MQTLSLLPSQIKNRVGLQQQSPYPAETYGYPPSSASGYDSPSLASSSPAYDSMAFSQPAPLQPPAQIAPYANPAYAAPLAVAAAPVSIFSKPMTWVLGGLTAIGLGGLVYWKLDWIKDKLGIGGDAGKKERAKAQFETLKTRFTDAETPEAKKEIVKKMASIWQRNDSTLFNSLSSNELNTFKVELKILKEEGMDFAEKALTKASKALGKSSGDEKIPEALKTGAKEAGKALKNSDAGAVILRLAAVPATFLFGSAFLSLTGWGAVIAGFGTAAAGWISATGVPAVSGLATATAANTGVQIATLGLGTAGSAYTVANPNPLKRFISSIGDGLISIPRAIGNRIKKP